jgi:exodeoxyribonuclease VII large subunit
MTSNLKQESREETIVSVGQLTHSIKALLEGGVGAVAVRGEISNWRPASSGHIYFSLKDSDATISAALFRGAAVRVKTALKDGVEVICRGRISVYPPRGSYQIIVESMEPVGAGSLQAAFEALKKKLHGEGLFDPARKRALPLMPERIVVITSPTGAAVRDVLSVLKRRFSCVNVLVIPALVQGEEAARDLIRALRTANDHSLGDVILLTRGGGSLEDLWCFNSEDLAREIANSKIPVVSAVGHEIDFTIADFVADLRAPTPSAAAELLVRERQVVEQQIADAKTRLTRFIAAEMRQCKLKLAALLAKMKSPRDRINELRLRFDDWSDRLAMTVQKVIDRERQAIARLEDSLRALSPLQVLDRGYAIVFDAKGHAIRTAKQTKKGDALAIRVSDGSISAEVR